MDAVSRAAPDSSRLTVRKPRKRKGAPTGTFRASLRPPVPAPPATGFMTTVKKIIAVVWEWICSWFPCLRASLPLQEGEIRITHQKDQAIVKGLMFNDSRKDISNEKFERFLIGNLKSKRIKKATVSNIPPEFIRCYLNLGFKRETDKQSYNLVEPRQGAENTAVVRHLFFDKKGRKLDFWETSSKLPNPDANELRKVKALRTWLYDEFGRKICRTAPITQEDFEFVQTQWHWNYLSSKPSSDGRKKIAPSPQFKTHQAVLEFLLDRKWHHYAAVIPAPLFQNRTFVYRPQS